MKGTRFSISVIVVSMVAAPEGLHGQTPMDTAFIYQGQLKRDGAPATIGACPQQGEVQ